MGALAGISKLAHTVVLKDVNALQIFPASSCLIPSVTPTHGGIRLSPRGIFISIAD